MDISGGDRQRHLGQDPAGVRPGQHHVPAGLLHIDRVWGDISLPVHLLASNLFPGYQEKSFPILVGNFSSLDDSIRHSLNVSIDAK